MIFANETNGFCKGYYLWFILQPKYSNICITLLVNRHTTYTIIDRVDTDLFFFLICELYKKKFGVKLFLGIIKI